ncbi:MAG: cytochrome c [Anaerolineae bacterium]|nr:cytochrome c [Anaerolineae bacterium]
MVMVGLAALILLVVAAALALSSTPSYAVDPTNPQSVALGKQVYDVQCASCHGANLEGQEGYGQPSEDGLLKAPPHDETGHTWHHNNAYLIESIKKGGARLPADVGVSAMPPYENILKPAEIGAVLSYIQSTWPEEIAAQQAMR